MNSSAKNSNQKSVLSFYVFNGIDIDKLDFEQIWDNFVEKKVEGVACKNVLHFDMTTDELAKLIQNKNNLDQKLIDDINDEYINGSDYIFVLPVMGRPIFGIDIHKLATA